MSTQPRATKISQSCRSQSATRSYTHTHTSPACQTLGQGSHPADADADEKWQFKSDGSDDDDEIGALEIDQSEDAISFSWCAEDKEDALVGRLPPPSQNKAANMYDDDSTTLTSTPTPRKSRAARYRASEVEVFVGFVLSLAAASTAGTRKA